MVDMWFKTWAAGGVRSCLGWRFAYVIACLSSRILIPISASRIIEMQVIAAILLENFEFSLPPQTLETNITRKPLVLMVPMVEGRQYPWMGLKVRCLE
jgi:hypothetical protein